MMKLDITKFIKKYDFSFFIIQLVIFLIGVLNLYSATSTDPSDPMFGKYKAQIIFFAISLLIGIITSFIGVKSLYRFSYLFYGLNIFFLLLVLALGHTTYGAQRWLALGPIRFQPSETMKVVLVLALGRWFATKNPDVDLTLKDILIPFMLTLFPALLIVIQPDLGTGILMVLIFLVMTFYRRLKWKTIGIIALTTLLTAPLVYTFGLKNYQRQRIHTFINPYEDAQGKGYNAIQSEIAIGSGKLLGKGFKQSSQASLNYLPENHTDFVFSVFNEEHGFVGSLILISLFVFFLFKIIKLATTVNKFYDSLVAMGVMSIFYWHTLINMSMVMGLMPIVGIPLPLFSYGGSSLLTFGLCTGLITSISNERNLFHY